MNQTDTDKAKSIGTVFWFSVLCIGLFVAWGAIQPEQVGGQAEYLLTMIIRYFGWFYMLVTVIIIGFVLFAGFSRFGHIRLGKEDDRPEYSFYSWIGMLFAAGIGVGFVFWGAAEPLLYSVDPPPGFEAGTEAAAKAGLTHSVFHWALHPWAIFSLVALTLAYVQFRKNRPALISSAFYPLFGSKVEGPIGKVIDIIAVIATGIGVATTFGLSAVQMAGGLSRLAGTPNTLWMQLVLIAIVSVLFMISAATGLNKGIRLLSVTNLVIASILLVLVLVLGPTVFIANGFVTTIGSYLTNAVEMSFRTLPFGDGTSWAGEYTVFFWAWHISWAPFVGLFIARISKGRTIREFVLAVLFVPTVLAFLWFSTFGGTALYYEYIEGVKIAKVVEQNVEYALFITLAELPLGNLLGGLAVVLILIFFITSADSASYVLGSLSSKGSLNPSLPVKITWGVLIAGAASILLVSGGLEGLQKAAIIVALPFTCILLLMAVSLLCMLQNDRGSYVAGKIKKGGSDPKLRG